MKKISAMNDDEDDDELPAISYPTSLYRTVQQEEW